MALAVKVDEDLPRASVQLLSEHGYEAVGVIDQQMGGWKDPDLWKAVQAENRFLVTADKGFADLRIYPPGKHAGILLLRPDEDGIRPIIELLSKVLASCQLDDLVGSVTVVTPRGIRTRKA
jgi:predicted nuclease of predicted toxin-antitoxin system